MTLLCRPPFPGGIAFASARHLAVLLKFMEYCEPGPADYSLMRDEELMEKAMAAGLTFEGIAPDNE